MGCPFDKCTNDTDPNKSYHYVFIASFDHDDKVDGSGKAGITLGIYISQKMQ